MYFFGKKSNESFAHVSPQYRSPVRASEQECFNSEVLPKHGGVLSDYSVFIAADQSDIENRVVQGDAFELVWDGNEVVDVSFAPEDAKPILKISIQNNKTLILADGIDSSVLELRLVDDDDVLVPFSGDIMAPIRTPKMHSKLVKMTFVNGVCNRTIKTKTSGEWMIPSTKPTSFRFKGPYIFVNSYDEGDEV